MNKASLSLPRRLAACLVVVGCLTLSAQGQSRRPEKKEKPADDVSISVLDSSDAQWNMRSMNDTVYRNTPMNAAYFERDRVKLPDSFKMYRPKSLGDDMVVKTGSSDLQIDGVAPTTIRVNGKDQPLKQGP